MNEAVVELLAEVEAAAEELSDVVQLLAEPWRNDLPDWQRRRGATAGAGLGVAVAVPRDLGGVCCIERFRVILTANPAARTGSRGRKRVDAPRCGTAPDDRRGTWQEIFLRRSPGIAPCNRPRASTVEPWCIVWCMRRTNIYLDASQTAVLDRLASEEGVSRAEVIRRLLDRALASQDDDLAADLAAIDESFGALQDVDVPSRDAGDREDHLTRMWQIAS
jgi:Ribbon-helix-helix protein, copG family